MKHNLANRPIFVSAKYGKLVATQGHEETLRIYVHDAEDWFEGFEKELVEALDQVAFTTTMVRNIGTGHKKKLWVSVDDVKRLVLGVKV